MTIPLYAAAMLSLVSFFSERLIRYFEKYHQQILSFSAGIFISAIFLHFLPLIGAATTEVGITIYVILLLGFATFHVSEKYIYQHTFARKQMIKELAELHVLGFMIDHFILGYFLVLTFMLENPYLMYFLTVPFLIHMISSAHSLKHIRKSFRLSLLGKIMLSSAPLLGAIAGTYMLFSLVMDYSIFSFLTGALLYLVTKDVIPEEREGKPKWFIIGIAIALPILYIV